MTCNRCKSPMSMEIFYGNGGGETFSGWRCIFCGEIVDPLILENRTKGGKDYVSKSNSSHEASPGPIEEG